MAKVVVAVGGNALGNTPEEQKEIVKKTAKHLVDFIVKGNEMIIVHGNGPQIGMINNGFDTAHKHDSKLPLIDFPECGAMSQGFIGYHLQQAIANELQSRNIDKSVATLITQTVVDINDQAFKNPSKPIGNFMTEQEAKRLANSNSWDVKEDAGRGWRRVVASPKPIDIVEKEMINMLINNGCITISTGGGGIPVINNQGIYQGIAAVVDKDFAAAKVAEITNADALVILTAIDRVAINYLKPDQAEIEVMTKAMAQQYIVEKQFAPGSMLPKVEAALSFVELTNGKPAYVGSLEKVEAVLEGKSGTKFIL